MATDDRVDRSEPRPAEPRPAEPPPVDAIDVEERLRRVKRTAGRPRLRRRLARLVGEPARTDRVMIAAAGSACATTVVVTTYLWWRDRQTVTRNAGR